MSHGISNIEIERVSKNINNADLNENLQNKQVRNVT